MKTYFGWLCVALALANLAAYLYNLPYVASNLAAFILVNFIFFIFEMFDTDY